MSISPIGSINNNCKLKLMNHTVTISGVIDELNPGEYLKPFFEEVHNSVIKENEIFNDKAIKNLVVDIKMLDFINSSGIRELVKWILKITKLSEDQQYKLQFKINKNLNWQVKLIGTLKILSHRLIDEFI